MDFPPRVILCTIGEVGDVDRRNGGTTVFRACRREGIWEKRALAAAQCCSRKRPPGIAGTRHDFKGSKVSLHFTSRLSLLSFVTSGDEFRPEALVLELISKFLCKFFG